MRSFLGVLACLFATIAGAQDWPQRTVRFLVTLGPGSGAYGPNRSQPPLPVVTMPEPSWRRPTSVPIWGSSTE